MRYIISVSLLICLILSGCTKNTKYGACYGIVDNSPPDKSLFYQASDFNVFLAGIFCETVFVPIAVFGWDLYCPIGHIEDKK